MDGIYYIRYKLYGGLYYNYNKKPLDHVKISSVLYSEKIT